MRETLELGPCPHADERLRDELDALAQVLLGGRSNAAANWQRAIYG